MELRLLFDRQALTDLAAIRDYLIAEAGTVIAERVRTHLRNRMESLRHNPRIGVRASEPDIRVLPPARYPYRIYYTILPNAIVILHVRHSARRDPDFEALSN